MEQLVYNWCVNISQQSFLKKCFPQHMILISAPSAPSGPRVGRFVIAV